MSKEVEKVDYNLSYPVLFPSNELSKDLSKKYGYKEWMVSRFLNYVPNPKKLLEYIDDIENLHTYIRTNTLKISPNVLKKRLIAKGFQLKDTLLDEVFEIVNLHSYNSTLSSKDESIPEDNNDISFQNSLLDLAKNSSRQNHRLPSIGSTIEYLKGYYYIQDLSSCIAVNELEIPYSENLVVLDMAAAPGGKTTHIAQKLNNNGLIVACESNSKRLSSLIFNLSRCFVKNTAVFNLRSERVENLGIKFDRVLLDAPCTCEGIIQKDVSRKKSRKLRDLEICSELQKKLIIAGFSVLKPNGIMVYSTCSFAPEENEMVIQYLIDNFDDARIEPVQLGSDGLRKFNNFEFTDRMNYTKRFYPHFHDTNGFFIAKIRKEYVTSNAAA
jgi:tRNA (cytosine40_48-C5)-methyltransferase